MGFFKRLKDRLFLIEGDQKIKNVLSKKVSKANSVSQNEQTSVTEKNQKISRQEEKKLLKERKKSQKLNKYIAGLNKTNISFVQSIKELQTQNFEIDETFFEKLEEILIMSDISYKLVSTIIAEVKREVKLENIKDSKLIGEIIADKIFTVYANQSIVDTELNVKHNQKNVILIAGVNGSGKTTTIGKIGSKLIAKDFKVLIAAADTFRAGAIDQLEIWANLIGARLIKPKKLQADPASVVYEAMDILLNESYDVLLIDTAGRLQNKVNLMNELQKIYQIIQKKLPSAPHESLLVLDATTGQNGLLQAKQFTEIINLTGIILTKMDGTSKGGIILTIKDELSLAVKYLGLGEKIEDLQEFDLDAFIYGMMQGLIDEK